jgi:hypothetical protein
MKKCSKCGLSKESETSFYKNAASPDGRHSICNSCRSARNAAYAKLARDAKRNGTPLPERKRAKFPDKERWKRTATKWRRRAKIRAVEYKGGKCQICGYCKNVVALQFHHREPAKKEFGISARVSGWKWEKLKIELDKCDLLCANCHFEEEDRLYLDKNPFVKEISKF